MAGLLTTLTPRRETTDMMGSFCLCQVDRCDLCNGVNSNLIDVQRELVTGRVVGVVEARCRGV